MDVYVDYNVLVSLLQKNFPNFSLKDSWIIDAKYKALFIRDLAKLVMGWVQWLRENEREWLPDDYDCDDFAEDFRRFCVRNFYYVHPLIAIGKLYTPKGDWGYHAWNIIATYKWLDVAPDFRLWEFEPQTGDIIMNHELEGFKYELWWVLA